MSKDLDSLLRDAHWTSEHFAGVVKLHGGSKEEAMVTLRKVAQLRRESDAGKPE